MKRQRHGRQARLAILIGLTVFAGLQVGAALVIEHWLPVLRDPYYGNKVNRLRRRLEQAPADSQCLVVLGSSRVLHGFKWDVLEEAVGPEKPMVAFNFGIPGAGPMTQYLTLQRLLADGVRPDRVLIEVLPVMLDKREDTRKEWVPADWLSRRDLTIMRQAGLPTERLQQEYRTWWAVPTYTHRFVILAGVFPGLVSAKLGIMAGFQCDAGGYHPIMDAPAEARQRRFDSESSLYRPRLQDLRLGSAHCHALTLLLELCRREGIEADLLLMPEARPFRDLYSSASEESIDELLRALRRRFGVRVIDARDWVTSGGFIDGHHLIDKGARHFSRRLAGALEETPSPGKPAPPVEVLAGMP